MEIQRWVKKKDYINKFKKYNIQFRKYPELGLIIVKRRYGSKYSENKFWLNYCRGLIIDYNNNKTVFIPPTKSKECLTQGELDELDKSSEPLVDGTMINLFYHNNDWLISTRSNIGATNKWSSEDSFHEMFLECSDQLDYNSLDKDSTYSFVMRDKNNRLTSKVYKNELVLVEVYHKGIYQSELPKNNVYITIKEWVPDILYKGLTVKTNGIRYKWLTNEHKFIEMIKPNTNNPCLNYLTLRNSGHLTEYLKYFPEERFKFNKYRKTLHDITKLLYQIYTSVFIKKILDKETIPFHLKPLIYEINGEYLRSRQGITWEYIKNYIYELEPKRLTFVMNNLK
tara:strand:+ start:5057 stop:6076 length:1020 start_codon:yes stop_codon:yes gene_type:complete